jgi:hypothetical protein
MYCVYLFSILICCFCIAVGAGKYRQITELNKIKLDYQSICSELIPVSGIVF